MKNSGLTLEFRSLVAIGRSGWMVGSLCLKWSRNSYRVPSYYSKLVSNCPGSFLIVLAVFFVVLVVVLVALEVVLEQVKVTASNYCYRC